MKILVPVKRVLDYNVKPRVKADGTGVDLAKGLSGLWGRAGARATDAGCRANLEHYRLAPSDASTPRPR
jgi:hypothetical protein